MTDGRNIVTWVQPLVQSAKNPWKEEMFCFQDTGRTSHQNHVIAFHTIKPEWWGYQWWTIHWYIYSYIAYNTRWTERCNYHTANSTDKCLTATGTVIIDVEWYSEINLMELHYLDYNNTLKNNDSHHVWKEACVAEKLEWHSNDKSAKEEKAGQHEDISGVWDAVTTVTTNHDTIQLDTFTIAQCCPINICQSCHIPSIAFCNKHHM